MLKKKSSARLFIGAAPLVDNCMATRIIIFTVDFYRTRFVTLKTKIRAYMFMEALMHDDGQKNGDMQKWIEKCCIKLYFANQNSLPRLHYTGNTRKNLETKK